MTIDYEIKKKVIGLHIQGNGRNQIARIRNHIEDFGGNNHILDSELEVTTTTTAAFTDASIRLYY
jgi:hypothetical protein